MYLIPKDFIKKFQQLQFFQKYKGTLGKGLLLTAASQQQ